MFVEEAIWIKSAINGIILNAKKVANLGSSTEIFRREIQPHIHHEVIEPIQLSGAIVTHIDIKFDKGIDIAADLSSDNFANLIKEKYDLILCTNMLEHVEDINKVVKNILKVSKPNAYILITVPRRYPLHYDPIDNAFRPSPEEVISLFSRFQHIEVIKSDIIEIKDRHSYPVRKSRFPFWGYRIRMKYWLMYYYQVTGVLIRRIN